MNNSVEIFFNYISGKKVFCKIENNKNLKSFIFEIVKCNATKASVKVVSHNRFTLFRTGYRNYKKKFGYTDYSGDYVGDYSEDYVGKYIKELNYTTKEDDFIQVKEDGYKDTVLKNEFIDTEYTFDLDILKLI